MASSSETLQLILSAKDDASGVIAAVGRSTAEIKQKADQAAGGLRNVTTVVNDLTDVIKIKRKHFKDLGDDFEGLSHAAKPLKVGLSQILDVFGLGGQAGHLFAGGLTKAAIGTTGLTFLVYGAVTAVTSMISAYSKAKESVEKVNEAYAKGDLHGVIEQMDEMHKMVADKRPFNIAATSFTDLSKRIVDFVSGATEKFQEFKEMAGWLELRNVNKIAGDFKRLTESLDAGPIRKIGIDFEKAISQLDAAKTKGEITDKQYAASEKGLIEIREKSIALAVHEAGLIPNRSPEVDAINQLVRAERALRAAKEGGGNAEVVRQNQIEVDALKTKVLLMDRVALKERLSGLQAITDGLKEEAIIANVNQEIERQKLLFDQGAISSFQLSKNLLALRQVPIIFESIKKAADDFFKTGITSGTSAIKEMLGKIIEVEKSAHQTYGVNIPADITTAIEKMKVFVKQIADAGDIDLPKLQAEMKAASASDYAGLSKPLGNLNDIRFVSEATGKLRALTGDWNKELKGVSGYFTNISGASEDSQRDMASVPGILATAKDSANTFAGSMGTAATNAGSVLTRLNEIEQKISDINAQGGIKVVQ